MPDRQHAAERRRKIADDVRQGMSFKKVTRKWGVSKATVSRACQENGVDASLSGGLLGGAIFKPTSKTLQIVAHLQQGLSGVKTAAALGVARQAVDHVRKVAREAGVVFPGESP